MRCTPSGTRPPASGDWTCLDLLLNPDRCAPAVPYLVQHWEQEGIDDAKRTAVKSALGSSDFFVVHGPPGTGKTTFIAELVAQEIARNPEVRILLTSQTHVALDNALITMRRVLPEGIRLTRLASIDGTRVDERVEDLLLERQLPAWRREIRRRSEKFLDRWAVDHGLELDKARAAVLLSELLGIKDSIAEIELAAEHAAREAKAEQGDEGADNHREQRRESPTPEGEPGDLEDHTIAESGDGSAREDPGAGMRAELEDLRRDERDTIRKLAAGLPMPRARIERMNAIELAGLYETIIPVATPTSEKLLRLIRLHREWVDRAARGAEFDTALLKMSNVVAATCVGLAGFPSAQELAFDLCVLDEASKATPTEALVPFVRSRRWVLVGDQYQLPPFQERALEEPEMVAEYALDVQELSRTIFDRLAGSLPSENSVLLRQQHRMTKAIGDLISHVFYAGQLLTERTDTLEGYDLALPKPVTWLSTSSLPNRHEARAGAGGVSFQNAAEADALVDFLIRLSFVTSRP